MPGRFTRTLAPVLAVPLILLGSCGGEVEEKTWTRSDGQLIGYLDLEDPLALQAFGFIFQALLPPDLEAEVPDFSEELAVSTYADWETGAGTGEANRGALGSVLHRDTDGSRWYEEGDWVTDPLEPNGRIQVGQTVSFPDPGSWFAVYGRADAVGPAASSPIQGLAVATVQAKGSAPLYGVSLELNDRATWHETVDTREFVMALPVGAAGVASPEVRVRVSTSEDVALFVSTRVTAEWPSGTSTEPSLFAEVQGAGVEGLGWPRDRLVSGETFIDSAPLPHAGPSVPPTREWTLRLVTEAEAPVETPVEIRWGFRVHAFGHEFAPPEDLVVEVDDSAG